jgi:FMN phosphatase YigB (HAD superfamily)
VAADDDIPPAPAASAISVEEVVRAVKVQGAEVVLLDIGGVLADDVWETLFLHPDGGIASRYGLDPAAVAETGRGLWEWASRRQLEESTYWAALEDRLEIQVSEDDRISLERLIRGNPDAPRLVAGLVAAGARVGVLSNNTSFWWPKQLRLAGTPDLGAPDLRFLSCEQGVSKGDHPGLIELSAARLGPSQCFLVDDRENHLIRAEAVGFGTLHYRFGRARRAIA